MKQLLFTFYFLLFTLYSQGQNLVPNNSFEVFSQCPNTTSRILYAIPWFQPNTFASSTDYFNICADTTSGVNVPNNFMGYQSAKTGFAYAGLNCFTGGSTNPNFGREYIEVKLDSQLLSGKKYIVSFYVSLANRSKYALARIGACFSMDSILYYDPNFSTVLPYKPQIENKFNNIISDTANWILIQDTLLATGGENYMTIGNFYDDSTFSVDTVSGNTNFCYYYIDDVSIVPVDSGNGVYELVGKKNEIIVSPNPSNGNMIFDYDINFKGTGFLIIRDGLGNKIREYPLRSGKNSLDIQETSLTNGCYFYEILSDNVRISIGKLLIIK